MTNRSERSKLVQQNKLRCFHNSVNVLKKSTTIQEYRRIVLPIGKEDKSGLCKTSIVEWFAFWAITSFEKRIRIRVIVRRIGGDSGQYHFWSVMPFWSLQRNTRNIRTIELEDE